MTRCPCDLQWSSSERLFSKFKSNPANKHHFDDKHFYFECAIGDEVTATLSSLLIRKFKKTILLSFLARSLRSLKNCKANIHVYLALDECQSNAK